MRVQANLKLVKLAAMPCPKWVVAIQRLLADPMQKYRALVTERPLFQEK